MTGRVYACASMVFAIAAIVVVGVNPASAGMISVDVTPSVSSVAVNDTFSVAITANSPQDIVAFGFRLSFDNAALTLDSVTVAPPFNPLYAPGATAADVAGWAFPAAPAGPAVLLATATFTAKTSGSPSVSLGVNPGDPTQGFAEKGTGGLSGQSINGAVLIVTPLSETGGGGGGDSVGGQGPSLPEPTTVLFMLGGLALLRRRSQPR